MITITHIINGKEVPNIEGKEIDDDEVYRLIKQIWERGRKDDCSKMGKRL